MGTLYLDRRNTALRVRGTSLELRIDGQLAQRLPLGLLERVVIRNPVEMDTGSLAALADRGIPVVLLHGRNPLRLAAVLGAPGNDPRRRLAQYAAWQDAGHKRRLAQTLLRAKLHAQQRFVQDLLAARPDARHALTGAAATLDALIHRLDSETPDLATLRGIEGSASAAGFRALQTCLPPSLGFIGRKRRPPPDPVNALLSLGYTLCHALALETGYAAGLDPAIGYLHEPLAGRASLAADLMEPLRPRIEQFTWDLFRQRTLTADHFTGKGENCRLGKSGRAIYYGHWEERAPAYHRLLRLAVRQLLRDIGEPAEEENST